MGKEKHQQKVIKYIRQDRPEKLKAYVRKHRIDLCSVESDRGGNLLHVCCTTSSAPVLRYLLAAGVNPLRRDTFQDLPLHLLMHRVLADLNKGGNSYPTVYEEMVLPYIEACPKAVSKKIAMGKPAAGKTAKDLVDRFLCMWEHRKEQKMYGRPPTGGGQTSEDRWREKLRDEWEDENQMNGGAYEKDFQESSGADKETYDEWVDRLFAERQRKRRAAYSYTRRPAPPLHGKPETSTDDFRKKQESYQEKLNREREKMKRKFKGVEAEADLAKKQLQSKRRKYEENFSELQAENSCVKELGFGDIPWPHEGPVSKVLDVLFVDIDKSDSAVFKKSVRDQIVRWHPDKFEQKFGHCLKSSDREKILLRVKEISQALNKLSKKS